MSSDPTPNEVQAAMIADLEAKLQLADEKQFYLASQNAGLRAALSDIRVKILGVLVLCPEANWYAADLKVAIIKADNVLDEPPYSV